MSKTQEKTVEVAEPKKLGLGVGVVTPEEPNRKPYLAAWLDGQQLNPCTGKGGMGKEFFVEFLFPIIQRSADNPEEARAVVEHGLNEYAKVKLPSRRSNAMPTGVKVF